jgi:thiol-disulfide isomerase/thioredoxin
MTARLPAFFVLYKKGENKMSIKLNGFIKMVIIITCIFLLAGCSAGNLNTVLTDSDEVMLKAIADNIKSAIENKDVKMFMDNISLDYSDSMERTYNSIYAMAQDIVDEIEAAEELAASYGVNLTIGTSITDLIIVGSEASSNLKITVDAKLLFITVYSYEMVFEVVYQKENGEWKIISLLEQAEFTSEAITEPDESEPGEPEPDEPGTDPDPITLNRVVMVELFVAPGCGRCPSAKSEMAQLLDEYGFDNIVVLEEYAWNFPLSSGWATPETISRYSMYNPSGGTPDAYFNGLNQSVHYYDSSYSNYKNAIDAELAKPAQIAISASISKDSSAQIISVSGSIQNISDSAFSDIAIGAMIYEDSVPLIVPDKPTYTANHVVRDILTLVQVDSLSSGGTYDFSFTADSEDLKWAKNFNNLHVVVYVQAPNSITQEILQAMYVD